MSSDEWETKQFKGATEKDMTEYFVFFSSHSIALSVSRLLAALKSTTCLRQSDLVFRGLLCFFDKFAEIGL